MINMDWRLLYFGAVGRSEVLVFVQDNHWQKVRLSMKGVSLAEKYRILTEYLAEEPNSRAYQVRVTNYVTALSRGGLIKPADYLEAGQK